MPKRVLPVYNIATFGHGGEPAQDFYANTFAAHVKDHHFVNAPHKHDFFLVILFTKGHGVHDVDFKSYPVKPGAVFMLSPGQAHSWNLSKDVDGYVFFHTRDFYDLYYTSEKIRDYPFFSSVHYSPRILLRRREREALIPVFKSVIGEWSSDRPMKLQQIRALVTRFYIELARLYLPGMKDAGVQGQYLNKVRKLESLVDLHFKTIKSPAAYARMMHVSERHLNRMGKLCLHKTVSELISDRVVLEAKRMLVNPGCSVAEVAAGLGYLDQSYFSRLFKKKSGQTPREFFHKYR